jgi:hypothetical protein
MFEGEPETFENLNEIEFFPKVEGAFTGAGCQDCHCSGGNAKRKIGESIVG